jgi:hypothetical protein
MGLGGLEALALTLLFALPGLALLSLIPAVQARRRGYSFVIWLLAGVAAFNPVFLMIVLATIPHRKRQQLREQFRRELDAKLAAGGVPAVLPAAPPVPERSLGDLATRLPGASAATDEPPVRERSLGDEPTVLPEARSVGDEPTRM